MDPISAGMAVAGGLSGLLSGGDSSEKKNARINEKEWVRRSTIEDEDRARKLAQDRMLQPIRAQLLQALAAKLGLPPDLLGALGGGGRGAPMDGRPIGDLPATRPQGLPDGGAVPLGGMTRPMPRPSTLDDYRQSAGADTWGAGAMERPALLGGGGGPMDLLPMRPQGLPNGAGAGAMGNPLRKLLAGRLGMRQ